MIAYKGFNKNLQCTLGKGTFQYEIGKTYTEEKARCASTGFHCVEEPIEVLDWYRGKEDRYCIVEAKGDVHEDGAERISCSEMKIVKEISLQQLGALECAWIQEHPERKHSTWIQRNRGTASENDIVIVRGKHPKAAGGMGATIFLIQEEKESKSIKAMGAYQIDGVSYLPDIYYNVDGRKCR